MSCYWLINDLKEELYYHIITEENHNKPNKYINGKIYVIRNSEDKSIYVGSTTQSLSKRFNDHKRGVERSAFPIYRKMNELGVDKFYIELFEKFPCESKEELNKREGEVIRKIGTLNKQIAGRSKEEWTVDNNEKAKGYKKKYNLTHKEELKTFRENRKERKAVYDKEYQMQNKERISENRGVKIQCRCGTMVSKRNISRHQKSLKCKSFTIST